MTLPLSDRAEEFLRYLDVMAYSPETVKTYAKALRQWERYLAWENVRQVRVRPRDVMRYMALVGSHTQSKATLTTKLAAIRAFHRYLELDERIREDPTRAVRAPRRRRSTRRPPAPARSTVELVRAQLRKDRDRVLFALMYEGMLRASEACGLLVEHVARDGSWIGVVGKGAKYGEVPLPAHVHELVADWRRRQRGPFMFPSTRAECGHVTYPTVYAVIRKAERAAKVRRRVHPHVLRGAGATHEADAGTMPHELKELLRHEQMTTQGYYTRPRPERHLKPHAA
jgi:site-specific recombinase XerD